MWNGMKAAAVGFVVLGISAPCAHAVIVTNGLNATLFSDNFEGDSDNAAPVADVGAWSTSGGAGTVVVGSGASPVAAEGSKYLQVTRPGTGFADFGQQSTGTLHTEFMVYVRSQNFASHGAQIILRNDALSAYASILSVQADGLVRYYDGAAYADSLASVSFDTWQKWTIDVDLTTDTYQFAIAGQQGLASPDALHEGATDLRYLVLSTGGGTNPQYLVDAVPVPEPMSAVALLALGGFCTARRRGR